MSQEGLKVKYLQQAQLLLSKTEKPTEKPRANVEPFARSLRPTQRESDQRYSQVYSGSDLAKFQNPHSRSRESSEEVRNKLSSACHTTPSLYTHPTAMKTDHLPEITDPINVKNKSNTYRQFEAPTDALCIDYHSQSAGSDFTFINQPHSSPNSKDQLYPVSSTPIAKPLNKQRDASLFSFDGIKTTFEVCQNCSDLDQRVKFLTEVNRELKRLLVASLGDNLKIQLEQIINEKAAMSCDLDVSLRQLADNLEVVDRVSIDCDIWRSKYLASRLMIDELAGLKAEVSSKFTESQRALQRILTERNELSGMLRECNDKLTKVVQGHKLAVKAVSIKRDGVSGTRDTILDVAQSTCSLVQLLYDYSHDQLTSVSGVSRPTESPSNDQHNHISAITLEPTRGEQLAKQILSSQERALPLPLKLRSSELTRDHLMNWTRVKTGLWLLDGDNNDVDFHCRSCKGPSFYV